MVLVHVFIGTAGRMEVEFKDLFRKIIGLTANSNHQQGRRKGWDRGGRPLGLAKGTGALEKWAKSST